MYYIDRFDAGSDRYAPCSTANNPWEAVHKAQAISIDRSNQTIITDETGAIVLWILPDGTVLAE